MIVQTLTGGEINHFEAFVQNPNKPFLLRKNTCSYSKIRTKGERNDRVPIDIAIPKASTMSLQRKMTLKMPRPITNCLWGVGLIDFIPKALTKT